MKGQGICSVFVYTFIQGRIVLLWLTTNVIFDLNESTQNLYVWGLRTEP